MRPRISSTCEAPIGVFSSCSGTLPIRARFGLVSQRPAFSSSPLVSIAADGHTQCGIGGFPFPRRKGSAGFRKHFLQKFLEFVELRLLLKGGSDVRADARCASLSHGLFGAFHQYAGKTDGDLLSVHTGSMTANLGAVNVGTLCPLCAFLWLFPFGASKRSSSDNA